MELLTKCPGWFRRATRSFINGVQSTWFSARCGRQETGWFLAHTAVGPSDGGSTKRAIKIKRRLVINCPPVQKNYAKNMNGVDRNDRDSADYTTSIRINRVPAVFLLVAGPVIFSCYIIAVYLASGLKPAWKYRSQLTGRYDFQGLTIALIDYCIRLVWRLHMTKRISRNEDVPEKAFGLPLPASCLPSFAPQLLGLVLADRRGCRVRSRVGSIRDLSDSVKSP
jgi:hypothetical protein